MRENQKMTHSRALLTTVIVGCFCVVALQAQSTSNAWEDLNLATKHLDRATIHYETGFEPNLPFFEKAYKEFLHAIDDNTSVHANRDVLLSEIYQILGVKDPNTKEHHRLWAFFVRVFSSIDDVTFYLIKQPTIKTYLRNGGTLPDFTYDKENDVVTYKFNISGSSKDESLRHLAWVCPIKSEQTLEKDVTTLFEMLNEMGCKNMMDVAIHEITEISLLKQVRMTDPFWRWFSDGVANAITFDLLKKHFGEQKAADFAEKFDASEYEDIKSEINLQYWLTGSACLLLQDAPTEASQRINHARYAYATLEARRLIDTHGLECVKLILDDVRSKPSRKGQDLLDSIQHVTGEAMQDRLSQYHTFQTRKAGLKKYVPPFNEASKIKDHDPMVSLLFRLHDLRLPSEVQPLLGDYRYAAQLLFKMGHEQDADQVMENCVRFFSRPSYTHGKLMASEAFIMYALETGKPAKAKQAADTVLTAIPDNVPGLTVRMASHIEKRQLDEAKEIARKLVTLVDNEESQFHRMAQSVLAIQRKGPKKQEKPL